MASVRPQLLWFTTQTRSAGFHAIFLRFVAFDAALNHLFDTALRPAQILNREHDQLFATDYEEYTKRKALEQDEPNWIDDNSMLLWKAGGFLDGVQRGDYKPTP